ncbi:MAG: hypothetical protein LH650_14010 [Chloroflexi bacterium]|nr:hypothetical protein [Chloroflexota bacterium]
MTQPGDVRPSLLAKPPGDRYRAVAPVAVLERPRMARAVGLGVSVVLVLALLCALLRRVLDLSGGIIAVAVGGGWAIGAAVRRGAWGGQPHRASSSPVLLGALLGGVCWLAGLTGAWLVAMAILPGSSRSFPDRLTGTPFLDWMGPQLGVADLLSLVLFVALGWFGARSVATRA